jgi:dienelactone hydrolase
MMYWRQDLARTLDYLQTRPEVDSTRVGYLGVSRGASFALPLLALEERLKVAILLSGGLPPTALPAEVDPMNFVPRIRIPVLMISSNQDNLFPVEISQKPLMSMLGANPRQKRYITAAGGHTQLPRSLVIRESLDWLDQHLGAVR